MTEAATKIRIGLDAGYDPGWPAALIYVRNVVTTLLVLPPDERPRIRLLPVNVETVRRIEDLVDVPGVEIARPRWRTRAALEAALKLRRAKRRFAQPWLGRVLDPAFKAVDVTFPGFGRPLPGIPQMHWIPDFQHVHLPDLFSEADRRERDRRMREMAATDGVVVLSSDAALDDFRRFAPRHRARPHVWRFSTGIEASDLSGDDPRTRLNLPPAYLYIGNQFWAHKDHLTVFKALEILRGRGLRPIVVCTGLLEDNRDPDHVPTLRRFLGDRGLADQVRLLGLVSRAEQIAVLRYATAVIQPSRFEGWSTVVEDAKGLGKTLVLSNLPVHLEQAPTSLFFEVGSAPSLAQVLSEVLATAPPGRDPERERLALAETADARLRSARAFMTIVRDALS